MTLVTGVKDGTNDLLDGSVANHLAAAFGCADDPDAVALIDAALVLLADHELAASTLAARVAASARCDPYAVVLAGTAVVSGLRHGAASSLMEGTLADVAGGTDPAQALARHRDPAAWSRRWDIPSTRTVTPGPAGSSRSSMTAIPATGTNHSMRSWGAARQRGLPAPKIDAALAGLAHTLGAPVGSGEQLFTIARTADWVAHALEQYATPELLRPQAVYTAG